MIIPPPVIHLAAKAVKAAIAIAGAALVKDAVDDLYNAGKQHLREQPQESAVHGAAGGSPLISIPSRWTVSGLDRP